MAVEGRKRKKRIVFFVATYYKGRIYYERSGTDRREAERLNARREKEKKAGTYQPPMARAPNITVRQLAERWLARRKNRSRVHDAYLMRQVLLGREWFASMAADEVRPRHVIQLAQELQSERAHKTTTNAISLLAVMYRDAVIEELIPASPVVLPRGLLKRKAKRTQPYTADEVHKLLSLPAPHGIVAALAFYTGMRAGEIAGRRWRDIDFNTKPLAALTINSQYNDQPLKGDDGDKSRERVVPVHPELARSLIEWRDGADGWRFVFAAEPGPDDWIVPTRRRSRDGSQPYTKSGIYQLWCDACRLAGIPHRKMHATRTTFVTYARRSSARTDIIESFTHNAADAMIDRYNVFQWRPRCDVLGGLSFEPDSGADSGGTLGATGTDGVSSLQSLDSKGRLSTRNLGRLRN